MPTLLLIDDSALFLKIMERGLSGQFRILGRAQDGLKGFDLYNQLHPDLVLLDITMPNVNGKDCLRQIMEADPKAKVIMVSSLGDEHTVAECLALGAKAFFNKDGISAQGVNADCALSRLMKRVLAGQKAEAV